MVRLLPSSALLPAALLAACSLPDVNLATREPLKVDINVDLNVYQHATPEAAKAADEEAESLEEAAKRKYNRQAEIQELKNQRFVAESHRGVLILRTPPAGSYGDYVKRTVNEENADRMLLMRADAMKQKRELQEIMRERYEANVANSHAGEWIEVPDPEKPGSWILSRKE